MYLIFFFLFCCCYDFSYFCHTFLLSSACLLPPLWPFQTCLPSFIPSFHSSIKGECLKNLSDRKFCGGRGWPNCSYLPFHSYISTLSGRVVHFYLSPLFIGLPVSSAVTGFLCSTVLHGCRAGELFATGPDTKSSYWMFAPLLLISISLFCYR